MTAQGDGHPRAGIRISGALLDLGGVLFIGQQVLPGAAAALGRLRESGLRFRFLTNTTRRSVARLAADLERMGLAIGATEILAPAQLARRHLAERDLTPHLLVHPDLEEEFAGLAGGRGEAVVIGDAGERFTYASLNAAYRRLERGAAFVALAMNRNFRDADGELSLDAGPFVKALEYAANREATVLGKPSPTFFELALAALGTSPEETVMVGDDVEADIAGAQAVGLIGVLVRTGKYRQGDENRVEPQPAHVADDFAAAVEWILAHAA